MDDVLLDKFASLERCLMRVMTVVPEFSATWRACEISRA